MHIKAWQYRQIDRSHDIHMQAFLNFAASATRESGGKRRPVYRTFQQFFDYQAEIRKLEGKKKPSAHSHWREFKKRKEEEKKHGRKLRSSSDAERP